MRNKTSNFISHQTRIMGVLCILSLEYFEMVSVACVCFCWWPLFESSCFAATLSNIKLWWKLICGTCAPKHIGINKYCNCRKPQNSLSMIVRYFVTYEEFFLYFQIFKIYISLLWNVSASCQSNRSIKFVYKKGVWKLSFTCLISCIQLKKYSKQSENYWLFVNIWICWSTQWN